MAERPVYETYKIAPYVKPVSVHFKWSGGTSTEQKKSNIREIHSSYLAMNPGKKVLEVSSKSEVELGVALSAFNLMLPMGDRKVPVECAYQAGKVFEHGGPYTDLLEVTPREAKLDTRLVESGCVVGFSLNDEKFRNKPIDGFYRWLYLNALIANPELADQLLAYDAFTDIEFNPKRGLSCQAAAAATYVSLVKAGKLEKAMADKEAFLWIVYRSLP